MDQREKADHFRALHARDEILVLLNAWDVASARVFAGAGALAVGTTSMGIAATEGYAEPEHIPRDAMVAAVARIAAGVDVPVSADMEGGFGATADEVVETVRLAIAAGAVGINVEDGTGDPEAPLRATRDMAERIAAIRALSNELGLHLVVNARTDVFLRKVGAEEERLASTITRGQAYHEAGADCFFVPGGLPREVIATLVREVPCPLNVVANPAISVPVVPSVPELQDLGVRRVSVGAGAMRSTLALTRRIADEVLGAGTYEAMKRELDDPIAPEAYRSAVGLSGA